jgi:hypothetical protein
VDPFRRCWDEDKVLLFRLREIRENRRGCVGGGDGAALSGSGAGVGGHVTLILLSGRPDGMGVDGQIWVSNTFLYNERTCCSKLATSVSKLAISVISSFALGENVDDGTSQGREVEAVLLWPRALSKPNLTARSVFS